VLSLASYQKRKGCREVNSLRGKGRAQRRKILGGMAEAGEGPQEREVMFTWKKIATFCWEDLDKLKACSVLGKQLGWGEDMQEAQHLQYVCKNMTDVWFTILTWKTLTVSQTAHNKEFGKSCALTIRKPALQDPGSSYSTNILTDEDGHKVLQQKSQNHRMLRCGRDLCGSSSPTPLLKQGHPERAAQDLVQAGLEYLQRRRLHKLPRQPVPGLRHPQREEVLPHVQTELPVPHFMPIAPCPVTGDHWNEFGPILLTPTLQIFVSIY